MYLGEDSWRVWGRSPGTMVQKAHARREFMTISRAVGRSENSGVPVLFRRHNLPPLVEIGLTDWPKIGGAMAPLEPPGNDRPDKGFLQICLRLSGKTDESGPQPWNKQQTTFPLFQLPTFWKMELFFHQCNFNFNWIYNKKNLWNESNLNFHLLWFCSLIYCLLRFLMSWFFNQTQ